MVEWSLVVFTGISALVGSSLALALARFTVMSLPGTDLDVDSYLEIPGISLAANRAVYEAHYLEFEYAFEDDVSLNVEFCEGADGFVFTRISYRFDPSLSLGVRLMTEHDDRVASRVLQIREVSIDDPEFDDSFLVFCHDSERVKRLFEGPARTRLLDLGAQVSELRLTDEGLAVSTTRVLKADELCALAEQVVDTAQSYEDAAASLDNDEAIEEAEQHEDALGEAKETTGRGRERAEDEEGEK